MFFNEKLPEWNNAGVEPPQSKKDEGFISGEKPPAQWFNWLLNRIYKAIQELREKVVVKVAGKDLSSNDYTTEEKIKLGGISKQATKVESSSINGNVKIDGVNAKVYEHPSSHPAEMIEESATKKFVSTSQINNWDSKETPTGAQAKANTAEQNAKNYIGTLINNINADIGNINDNTLPDELKGKSLTQQTKQLFQSGLDGKNLLEASIKSKGGTVSKAGEIASFNELDLGIKSIETDKTGDATAVAADILKDKTAYAKGSKLTGTMSNRGAVTITPKSADQEIMSGYHNGSGKVIGDANLAGYNIANGKKIFNIAGTHPNITESINAPSGGYDGDYWIQL